MIFSANTQGKRALSLIECLLYIALFFVVATLAFVSYYRAHDETRALNRNADDIVRAMKVGEQWRADVRQAIQLPLIENGALKLTTKAGQVTYSVREKALWRQAAQGKPQPVLERIRFSSMQPNQREHVSAWRWELELETKRARASVRPLFTFLAVPVSEVKR